MIIPSSRRFAVVFAAAVFLGRAASANTGDAAFASALGDFRAPLATMAQFKAVPQKPVTPKAPSAPDAVWQKVVEAVKNDGKFKSGAGLMPSSFSLEDVAGNPKADHTMQGITFVGMINDEEQFEAMGAMIVAMDFKLDAKDGNWHIDQWIFQTDVYGQVMNAGHGMMIKAPDGKVVSAVPEKLNPADPKIQAQYDAMLKHWAERKP